MHHLPLLSTASVASALAPLFINAVAGIVMLYTTVRVVRSPRLWFKHGRLAKAFWLIIVLWLTWQSAGVVVPVGAVIALWHLRNLSQHQQSTGTIGVTFASGEPPRAKDKS